MKLELSFLDFKNPMISDDHNKHSTKAKCDDFKPSIIYPCKLLKIKVLSIKTDSTTFVEP